MGIWESWSAGREILCEGAGQRLHNEVTQRWWNHLLWRFSEPVKTSSWELVIPWGKGWTRWPPEGAFQPDLLRFKQQIKHILCGKSDLVWVVLQSTSFNCMLCSQLDLDHKPTFLYISETKIKSWTCHQFCSALQKWWKLSWFHSKRDV